MTPYQVNPYVSFIESRLFSDSIQYAVFHRLTNEIIEPSETVRSLLHAAKLGNRISLSDAQLGQLGETGVELKQLIQKQFLILENNDPLSLLRNHYLARPLQNPAVVFQRSGQWILSRTSMEHSVYSRRRNEMPVVIEELLSSLCADIFLLSDGTRTLQQVFTMLRSDRVNILQDFEFRTTLDFLTTQERQLIKLTPQQDDVTEPYKPVNIVPRNLYHADRWNQQSPDSSREGILDFHLRGIEEAGWEFDQIEPTINHGYRFPHEALGGLNYGSRFCLATLRSEVAPSLGQSRRLNVLEVGGGTGTFARSFMEEAMRFGSSGSKGVTLSYHILDLSPALMESQKRILSEFLPESKHFQQDATEFDLPGHTFDLIISNEVIADFPVAPVERLPANESERKAEDSRTWQGDGAQYVSKYDLATKDAPDSFLVNAGAFRFVERAWEHLKPGGTLIISEYGAVERYPARSFHLNHDEYSIHFGHLAACGAKVGFECRLLTLKDFLSLDDDVEVLSGREEHILCLNHVFKNYGLTLPYAVTSKSDFERQCETVARKINLTGYSFLPIKMGYHFGPNVKDFFVLIMNKPADGSKEI
jgi:SAM-dependent methyltransferase